MLLKPVHDDDFNLMKVVRWFHLLWMRACLFTLRRWDWSFKAFSGAPPSRLKHWSSIAKKLLRSGVLRLATGSSLNSSKLQQRDYQQPQQTTIMETQRMRTLTKQNKITFENFRTQLNSSEIWWWAHCPIRIIVKVKEKQQVLKSGALSLDCSHRIQNEELSSSSRWWIY